MSNVPKHTPGPWRYQREITTGFQRPTETRFEVYTAKGKYGHPATCEREEDARLIAAAPGLLKAAKALRAAQVAYMSDRGNAELGRAVGAAAVGLDEAIAKAEGK